MTWIVEDPWPILLLGIAAEAILVVLLLQSGRGVILAVIAAVAVLTAALLVVEWWVVTDVERIDAVLYRAAAAVHNNDMEGVLDCLAPEARGLRTSVAAQLGNLTILEARITGRPNSRINRLTDPLAATATFFGRIRVQHGLGINGDGPLIGRVTIELEKTGDRWAITGYQLPR